jgi:hypothetical protein
MKLEFCMVVEIHIAFEVGFKMEALYANSGICYTTVQQTYSLKMEAVCSSEMLITNYQSTWCHNSENCVNKGSFVFVETDKPNHLYAGMYGNRMSTDGKFQIFPATGPHAQPI